MEVLVHALACCCCEQGGRRGAVQGRTAKGTAEREEVGWEMEALVGEARRRAMGEGATSMEEEPSSSLQPWEEGLPALACVQGEEGRKMLWRLKEMEGWECKVAKSKGRGTLFIEGALGLGFP